jgi:hypothetical protein
VSAQLNHIIIPSKEKWAAAKFLANILDLEIGPEWGPFVPVRMSNGVTLDFVDAGDSRISARRCCARIISQPLHYAFLVSEAEFDAALSRLRDTGVAFYADFTRKKSSEINHLCGGRGVYFEHPDGHQLELITQPHGPTPKCEHENLEKI